LGRPFAPLFDKVKPLKPLAAMLRLAPSSVAGASDAARPGARTVAGPRRARVAILTGCAQPVLKPSINEATLRLLARFNVEVVVPEGEGCCGALVHHMGREHESHEAAKRNIDAWLKVEAEGGLDAIIITASGCGTTIKDYGHMLRLDDAYAAKAAHVSAKAKDITEFLATLELPKSDAAAGMVLAYHSACSMQHGQKITDLPKTLLKNAGFDVREPREGHLCCGSAGVYNIMQPEISAKLLARKVANLTATKARLVATGNIGCITQIASAASMPIIHTVELLDWAYGGPKPVGLPAQDSMLVAAE
jgi:glycolate oxidase iron-sulfur subunit